MIASGKHGTVSLVEIFGFTKNVLKAQGNIRIDHINGYE
tara:strand:- start:573 stop:689 length:117 start_codon:yes stop_codon:yes gene_type:complete